MIQYLVNKHKTKLFEVGMDTKAKSQQPISDDQELAKVLAGVNQQADEAVAESTLPELPPIPPAPSASDAPDADASSADASLTPMPDPIAIPDPALPAQGGYAPAPVAPMGGSDLDGIKQEALGELRPLVDKLNVSPEEKFDTYLLLLRSTDDHTLVAPAHDAAKNIVDEARRAQALLDIIKEIDFLSNPQQ